MSKESGYETAINLAIEKLRTVDVVNRCTLLGLPVPQSNRLAFRAFGTDMTLHLDDFQLLLANSNKPAKVSDRILVLHYLQCETPIHVTHDLISFRQMEGGIFYWQAFLSRSIQPLIQRIGNNLDTLRANLNRLDWHPLPMGDLGAHIHAIGNVSVTLVYHPGDEEFGPDAEFLFDASIKQIYPTEDAAVLASRMCLSLL
ncbi:MAG: DUF3786 domain-containing protein [Candidatus Omnitrophota bacterium]